ncbi:dTMP kinase [Wolbachia pipientis]|uniref:Thymidylate kinase n=1 Tax=Wolbachia pipientis TaxID=955 RepID=A0A1E7QJW6_WOLPI|nr:dTMP kinase [Wolbachia pipientis]OEY86772.1 dTMP kinase [Wolbachia pipientis]
MFITFEGIDGSGKTTQSKLLADCFAYHDVVLTREPGGTYFAEKIRKILLTSEIDRTAELLLLLSMRQEHMEKLILPSLQAGKIVICDRFIDSTIAYQGYGLGISLELIEKLHNLINIKYPDITFILDIDVKLALQRAQNKNKYEVMDLSFYNNVRKGFQTIAAKNRHRCHIIKETEKASSSQIHNTIINMVSIR